MRMENQTDNHSTEALSEVAGISSIYLLLAGIYKDVASADLLTSLKDSRVLGILEDLGCSFDENFLASEVDEDLVELMAVDFTQLFIGPTEFISPYESIFHKRDDDDWGKLWGADTVRVKKFIESAGIEFADDYGGIPDHISVELEFIGKVTEKVDEAMTAGNFNDAVYFLKMKKLFFDKHLSQWVPVFCDKAAAKAKTSFYREISRLLKSFIEMEHQDVVEDIKSLDGQNL